MRLNPALEAFDTNIDEIIQSMTSNLEHDLAGIKKPGKNWIADEVYKLTIEYRLGDRIKRLKRLIGYKRAKTQPHTQQGITDLQIDAAKDYPIEELYDGKLIRNKGLCPFHSEKTPSFVIKNNRYRCYGCNSFGDSIDFYMKQNNVNFINAVKYLSRN